MTYSHLTKSRSHGTPKRRPQSMRSVYLSNAQQNFRRLRSQCVPLRRRLSRMAAKTSSPASVVLVCLPRAVHFRGIQAKTGALCRLRHLHGRVLSVVGVSNPGRARELTPGRFQNLLHRGLPVAPSRLPRARTVRLKASADGAGRTTPLTATRIVKPQRLLVEWHKKDRWLLTPISLAERSSSRRADVTLTTCLVSRMLCRPHIRVACQRTGRTTPSQRRGRSKLKLSTATLTTSSLHWRLASCQPQHTQPMRTTLAARKGLSPMSLQDYVGWKIKSTAPSICWTAEPTSSKAHRAPRGRKATSSRLRGATQSQRV